MHAVAHLGVDPDEVHEHLQSIDAVPADVLASADGPAGLGRLALLGLTASGYDCYAYQSGGPEGMWCAWLGPLADVRAERDGGVPLTEWVERWRELVAEMGIPAPAPGEEARR